MLRALRGVFVVRAVLGVPWWVSAMFAALAYALCIAAPNLLQFEHPYFAGLDVAVQALPDAAPVAAGVFIAIAVANMLTALSTRAVTHHHRSITSILKLPPRELDLLVAEGFRHRSYVVEHTGQGLRLRKGGRVFVVCTTQAHDTVVDVAPVRAVVNTMTTEMADGAMILTTGAFTPEAGLYAAAHHITLFDGAALVNLIKDVHVEVPLDAR